jgi:hypothetical protein
MKLKRITQADLRAALARLRLSGGLLRRRPPGMPRQRGPRRGGYARPALRMTRLGLLLT